ncbi:MAG: hypothetical protein ACLUJ0_08535 [Ruthenibacterium lactatiformans]|uniref:hypothetical protein n=1 Tax=Ruthenibacterium lactatiformans TaxID=1550024 RepID=UPI0039913232
MPTSPAPLHKYSVSLKDVCMVGDRYTILHWAPALRLRWCCAVARRRRWPWQRHARRRVRRLAALGRLL